MSDSDEEYSDHLQLLMSETESDDSDCDSEPNYYIFVRNSKDSEWTSVDPFPDVIVTLEQAREAANPHKDDKIYIEIRESDETTVAYKWEKGDDEINEMNKMKQIILNHEATITQQLEKISQLETRIAELVE